MAGAIQRIEWDSAFFRKNIARLDITGPIPDAVALAEYCHKEQIDLIQACVNSADKNTIFALENLGFDFVDLRLVMSCDLKATPPFEKNNSIRLSTEADIAQLLAISHHSFTEVSRYNWKDFFSLAQIDAFYDLWLENGVKGKHDDFCLHYQQGDKILGFTTIKVRNHDAYIGIIAVANEWRGKGIGDALVQNVFAYAAQHNLASVSSATQGKNTATQNLYRKHGMKVTTMESWYYKKVNSL